MIQALNSTDVRPYEAAIPQGELDDLASRLDRVRWPDELEDAGWEYGVPLGYVHGLVEYWRTRFDWRAQEARLNAYPQFTTTIDGQRVHFLHVRSSERDALPLICTHRWPMSVFEYLDLIGPLTDPAAHGGDPADAFDVVIHSIPGVGFSGPTTDPGWDTRRVARADQAAMSFLQEFSSGGGLAYSAYQSAQPQTVAYALQDSPAGWLAWVGQLFRDAVDRDYIVANAATYWLTGTIGSSLRRYYAAAHTQDTATEPTTAPTGVAIFAQDFQSIRRFADRDHANIVSWNHYDTGSHFAPQDAPDQLVADLRQFFRALRTR